MKYFSKILAFLLVSLGVGVFIANAQNYTPLAPLPGTFTGAEGAETTNISLYLSGAIKLLIALGAALAVLFAIIGGVKYVAASINPSAKSDAIEDVQRALIGLAIILTSYLLLNSINPNLVRFDFLLPPVGTSPLQQYQALGGGSISSSCPNPNDASSACCPSGVNCSACLNCSKVGSSGVNYKPCGSGYVCFLNSTLLSKIKNVSGVTGWRITESWPPTVSHSSACHKNGTCADLNNTGGPTDPATIKIYYDAFKAVGLDVTYESTDCAPYVAGGIPVGDCGTFPTMTNHSSFHVK